MATRITPLLEGYTLARTLTWEGRLDDLLQKERQVVVFPPSQVAFATFALMTPGERRRLLRESYNAPTSEFSSDAFLPTGRAFFKDADAFIASVEEGIKRRHEGRAKLLNERYDKQLEDTAALSTGAAWRARSRRRGDERKTRFPFVHLINAEFANQTINPAIQLDCFCETYIENQAKERVHGNYADLSVVVDFHLATFATWINRLSAEEKMARGVLPAIAEFYEVAMPYSFDLPEGRLLVAEAVVRRYLTIPNHKKRPADLFGIDVFLNDHLESILKRSYAPALKKGDACLSVVKHSVNDKEHRNVLKGMFRFAESSGYFYAGFAVDFRGSRHETVSIVFSNPRRGREMHIVYDEKLGGLPLYLLKIGEDTWQREGLGVVQMRPDNPLQAGLRTPFVDNDRKTQRQMVAQFGLPQHDILQKNPAVRPAYEQLQAKMQKS